jgi:hypothetical protein
MGPFAFTWDPGRSSLTGTVPEAFASVYALPLVLHRVDAVSAPPRPAPEAPLAEPLWSFEAGAALWAGPTFADGVVCAGGEDGHVLALDPAHGERVWDFAAADSVLAAPAVDRARVYFGSFDGKVRALDARDGRLLWERDTRGAVVSTPAVAGDGIVVGNRAYDLLALDAASGKTRWKRYVWFSWVESSATVRDGVAYVGSSDAAALFAFDVATGRRLWATDVYGWAWGQPAVTAERVFVGISSTRGYLAEHQGGVMAVDRATGRPLWRYAAAPPKAGPFGFPGSPPSERAGCSSPVSTAACTPSPSSPAPGPGDGGSQNSESWRSVPATRPKSSPRRARTGSATGRTCLST